MPTATEYSQAIQNLRVTARDEELKEGEPALNPMGLPLQYSGNFAVVYQVQCPKTQKTWAVKCFTKQVDHRRERYEAISRHLKQARLPFMVDFKYQEEGILVSGHWHPIVKMDWVEGEVLNEFVASHLDKPRTLRQLHGLWLKLAQRLHAADVTHADLQHGNVLLVPANGREGHRLMLVDYDGMHVPALEGTDSGEVGHPAYQHPQRLREEIYSAQVDRFSHLVIFCAIHCLIVGGRDLWTHFDNGDNLLFRERDLTNPNDSELFHELWKLDDPAVHVLVGRLLLATEQPLSKVPLLDELHRDGKLLGLRREEERRAANVLDGAATTSPAGAVPTESPPGTEGEAARLSPQEAQEVALAFASANGIDLQETRANVYGSGSDVRWVANTWKSALPEVTSAYQSSDACPASAVMWLIIGTLLAAVVEFVFLFVTFWCLSLAFYWEFGDSSAAPSDRFTGAIAVFVLFLFFLIPAAGAGGIGGLIVGSMGKMGQNRNMAVAVIFAVVASLLAFVAAWFVVPGPAEHGSIAVWYGVAAFVFLLPLSFGLAAGASVVAEDRFCEPCEEYMLEEDLTKMKLGAMKALVLAIQQDKSQTVASILAERPGDDGKLKLFVCHRCLRSYLELTVNFSGKWKEDEQGGTHNESWLALSRQLRSEGTKFFRHATTARKRQSLEDSTPGAVKQGTLSQASIDRFGRDGTLRVACPHCSHAHSVASSNINSSVYCMGCGKEFELRTAEKSLSLESSEAETQGTSSQAPTPTQVGSTHDSDRCPHCGFSFAWNESYCTHCHYGR